MEFHIDATHGQHRSVTTDEKTGDQTFGQLLSGTQCAQFSTWPFTFFGWGNGIFIGGTGKATGATGTYENHFSGSYLQAGCKGGCPGPFGGFGQFTATVDGTLNLPNAKDDKDD